MVSLQVDRSGCKRIRLDGSTGGSLKRLVIDNGYAVHFYCDVAVAQGNVQFLPFACRFFGFYRRSDPGKDGPILPPQLSGRS